MSESGDGPIVAVLLAAGSARRFGSDKLAAALSDGTAIGLASAQTLARQCDELLIVVNPNKTSSQQLFEEAGYKTVVATRAGQGMGHSLACGIAHSAHAMAWLVALGDMPFVKASTVEALCAELRGGARIVRPRYGAHAGHPVGFNRCYLHELSSLDGDRGARALLQRERELVTELMVDDPGVVKDVDTPEELIAASEA